MSEKKTEKNKYCSICNYTANRSSDLTKHIKTQKHIKKSMIGEVFLQNLEKNTEENSNSKNINYECLFCCFNTNDKKDYRRHLSTKKHKKNEENEKINNSKILNTETDEINYKELFINTLLKEHKEMKETIEKQQKTINELIPKIGNNTINSNNKFNLNIFLNETCKDAISMEEFINKIQVSLSDLFYTKNKGIAEGVSNIFIENLNKIPLTQRPIHCTDVKRETIYIKNDTWEKDEKKEKTKDAIKKVSNLQTKNINKYKESNPDYMNHDKKKEDFINIIKVATSDIEGKEEKIIKNICKEVYLNEEIIKNDLLE